MTKIVISRCHGGFGISGEAIEHYAKLKGIELETKPSKWFDARMQHYHKGGDIFCDSDIERDDPDLIKTIETLGAKKCSDWASALKIVEIPDGVQWQIEEYDGLEWVAEKHRTWS